MRPASPDGRARPRWRPGRTIGARYHAASESRSSYVKDAGRGGRRPMLPAVSLDRQRSAGEGGEVWSVAPGSTHSPADGADGADGRWGILSGGWGYPVGGEEADVRGACFVDVVCLPARSRSFA